jgi:hypothetical protein
MYNYSIGKIEEGILADIVEHDYAPVFGCLLEHSKNLGSSRCKITLKRLLKTSLIVATLCHRGELEATTESVTGAKKYPKPHDNSK